MMATELCPREVHLNPQLAALAILDAALLALASGAALIAQDPAAQPLPPLVSTLLERTLELRRLLSRYTRALEQSRDKNDGQAEFPF
jgi:hypothetical protein